jgi:hypothetical protein
VMVPYSKEADAFLQNLKIEYMQQNDTLNLPGTANQQQLFYATVEQKNQPWLNQGLADSSITGLIVRTPLAAAINNPGNQTNRDRLTGLPLDEKGRYTVQVSVDGTQYSPKFLPCATADCIRTGKNLDTSDAGTLSYLKALDKKILNDINTGATVATVIFPVGIVANIATVVGPLTSVASGYMDNQFAKSAVKEAIQIAATQYLQRVYGLGEAVANRVTATVDLAGGWQAFIDRVQSEMNGEK